MPGGVPTPRRDWTFRATLMVAMFMIPLGWMIFLASQFGFLPKRVGSGFIGMISNSTYFGIGLLMLTYLRHRSREALWLMLLLIPPSMAFNFLSGSKTAFLSPAAMVVVAYIVVRRRIAIRWILVGIAAVIIIYPIAEFQRRVILHGNTRGAAYALRKTRRDDFAHLALRRQLRVRRLPEAGHPGDQPALRRPGNPVGDRPRLSEARALSRAAGRSATSCSPTSPASCGRTSRT